MDFFEQQELARRSTRKLIVLFAIAVLAVVVSVDFIAVVAYWSVGTPRGVAHSFATLPHGFIVLPTLVTLGLIFGGTAWQTFALSSGGEAVARMVDARAVDASTGDLLEKRLINVVEEMALAAGVAVPRVYVMDNEVGINAFAAGHSINDAVIAVTRGTLMRLSRDELQGVIGHEFSHILNGDMRLNIRLIGVLYGLLIVSMFGRMMLNIGGRVRGNRDNGAVMAAMFAGGAAMWAIGYIGVFFGRLIKAAVSRQREFLADASAVQFTRNPDSIGGALRKIGGLSREDGLGSRIDNAQAETLAHTFLGAARPSFVSGLWATHPPLEERVKRIYGRPMDWLEPKEDLVASALADASRAAFGAKTKSMDFELPASGALGAAMPAAAGPLAGMVMGGAAVASAITGKVGTIAPPRNEALSLDAQQRATLETLRKASADSTGAQLLVMALLIDKEDGIDPSQRDLIAQAFGAGGIAMVEALYANAQRLPPGARLPLVDVATPTLRKLPAETRERLLMLGHTLISADGRISLQEFLLFTMLKRRIGRDSGRAVPVKYSNASQLAAETGMVLSLLAAVRLPGEAQRAFAAGAAMLDGAAPTFVDQATLRLDKVGNALDRLNELAPLAKPQLIKAASAVAFIDGDTNWKAASTLRTICAALDAPLPPMAQKIYSPVAGEEAFGAMN